MPCAANAYAVADPVSPPPTMTTGVCRGPRWRGYEGTRAFGNVSIHGDRPYFVMRSAFYFDPINRLIRRDGISRRHGDHEDCKRRFYHVTTEDTGDTEAVSESGSAFDAAPRSGGPGG